MAARRERSKVASALVAGGAVAAFVVALQATGALELLELRLYDLRMKGMVPPTPREGPWPPPAHPEIVILNISERSIEWMKRRGIGWPWDRRELARLLRACAQEEFEAGVVLFDFFTLGDLDPYKGEPAIVEALKGPVPVYVAVPFRENPVPEADERADLGALLARHAIGVESDGSVGVPEVSGMSVILPVAGIAEAVAGICDVETPEDTDGITRRYRMLSRFRDRTYPSPALAALMAREKVRTVRIRGRNLTVGSVSVPLEPDGTIVLRYYTPGVSFSLRPAHEVLEGLETYEKAGKVDKFDPSLIKGKIVLVGTDAASLFDLKVTPIEDTTPGVEIHAIALANILNGEPMRPAPAGASALAVLLGALLAASVTRLTGPAAGGAAAAALFLGAGALNVALFRSRWVLDLGAPLAAVGLAYAVTSGVNYLYEGRQRQRVKREFQRYLSPKVVDKILGNMGALHLEGERKPLTIFFMDFAGFTALSETMDPTELKKLVSDYHHEAAEEVFRTEGTIDKFIGDAIMAFWNDPIPQPDHAVRACLTAVAAQKRLRGFAGRMRERGHPEMRARMGINTGVATVGDFGARGQVNYTAIGDEVNLASRLEGVNKEFGTEIVVSEATYAPVRERFEARELALIKVKGRKHPVRIFELLGPRGEVSPPQAEAARRFEAALEEFRARRFERAAEIFGTLAGGGDPASGVYRALCEEYRSSPPPSDWDGSYEMESK